MSISLIEYICECGHLKADHHSREYWCGVAITGPGIVAVLCPCMSYHSAWDCREKR